LFICECAASGRHKAFHSFIFQAVLKKVHDALTAGKDVRFVEWKADEVCSQGSLSAARFALLIVSILCSGVMRACLFNCCRLRFSTHTSSSQPSLSSTWSTCQRRTTPARRTSGMYALPSCALCALRNRCDVMPLPLNPTYVGL
jgi:hypothetical protein